jgi:hypothetical protein
MQKDWKEISKYSIAGSNGEESVFLEFDGKNYRLRNEFGNMFFEFDIVSGLFFTQRLASDIEDITASEVTQYLNEIAKEESPLAYDENSDLSKDQEDVDV